MLIWDPSIIKIKSIFQIFSFWIFRWWGLISVWKNHNDTDIKRKIFIKIDPWQQSEFQSPKIHNKFDSKMKQSSKIKLCWWLCEIMTLHLYASICMVDWKIFGFVRFDIIEKYGVTRDQQRYTKKHCCYKKINQKKRRLNYHFWSFWKSKSVIRLTLILESRKKSKTRDHHRACFAGKKNQSAALMRFLYVSVLWIFFPENTLGHGLKKWHIFLFSAAYFLSYWHMPFEICTIV